MASVPSPLCCNTLLTLIWHMSVCTLEIRKHDSHKSSKLLMAFFQWSLLVILHMKNKCRKWAEKLLYDKIMNLASILICSIPVATNIVRCRVPSPGLEVEHTFRWFFRPPQLMNPETVVGWNFGTNPHFVRRALVWENHRNPVVMCTVRRIY